MAEKNPLDQKLHDMDESNKIFEFAETVLGCSSEQADVMSRTMRHKFTWSGVRLLYNGDAGDEKVVAVDHVDRIREALTRDHFEFLLPKPGATVDGFSGATIPGELLESALNGSLTSKSKICMDFMGGDNKDAAARTELLLKTEKAKRDGAVNGVDSHPHGQTRAEMNGGGNHATNPFVGLRFGASHPKAGQIDPIKMAKVQSFIKAAGAKAAAAVAKSAGLRLDGSPIPEQYK